MRLQDTLAAALVTLLVDGLAGMVVSPKEPELCQGRLDGVYANHDNECKDYYVCKSGQQSHKKACPEGLRFSALRNACMPTKEVACLAPSPHDTVSNEFESSDPEEWTGFRCDDRQDGVYVELAEDCQQFYICKAGALTSHFCPEGQRFSHVTGFCMAAEDVMCGLPVVRDVCPNDKQAFYADKPSGCAGFYRCKDGDRQDFTCPEDLVFDEALEACVYAASTKCDVTADPGDSDLRIPVKTRRQIKFFRFNGGANLDAPMQERQVKFGSKRQQRQIKFKRVNQLLMELRGMVKN